MPKDQVAQGTGARAGWNQGWLRFIGGGIGYAWCDYAGCKVKYSAVEGQFLDPFRKFKGRAELQGNNVHDENSEIALFSELGSSPAV